MNVEQYNKQDLRLRLLALYLVFVVLIFAVALVFYYNASQRLRADVTAADLRLARAIALETDDMLLKAKEAVAAFAQMPDVVTANPSGMEKIFSAGAAARQDINLVYRLSGDGIMLYHFPPSPGSTVGQDFSFRDYFQIARNSGQHVFSKGRISPTTNRPVVTSVMPIFKDEQFAGVVATNLELQRLTETIRRIDPEQTGEGGEKIIIVDSSGQVIAHSEANQLLNNIQDVLPGVSEVLAGNEGSFTATDSSRVEWLYSYTPVPSAGWGVIVQRPTQQAFASLNSFQRGLILALTILGLGALYFWVMLSRRVIVPLEKLTRYGRTVGDNSVAATVDRDNILPIARRPDQIGLLTRTLLKAEDEVRQRLLELTTLNKTSTTVVSTLDTQQVIDSILDEIQRLLSVRQCALLIVNESHNQLEVLASHGLDKNYPTRIKLNKTTQTLPAMQAITTNKPVQVPDLESDTNILEILSSTRVEGYRSGLIIPLNAPHIPPAALAIYRADTHQFTKQEIDLATSFANHAAIALEHATLFGLTDAELQKQVRSLSAINRVGRTVSQSLMLDDVLNNALDAVFEIMPADSCWIFLQRETENFLRLRAERGLPPDLFERIRNQRVEYKRGAIGRVAQSGQPLLLEDLPSQLNQWLDDPLVAEGDWQSLAAAPLRAKDTIIGVLGMASQSDRTFTETEIELLQAIGNQIAIAVVNARLYRRSREMATLEERNRMAREIHDTLAQGFTGILVQLQAAERLSLKEPEKAVESVKEARELARESLQEARRSVLNLRPTVLEDFTLDQAIAQRVHRFEQESGLQTSFVLEGYPRPLTADAEQNMYRIAQESLTNIQRHANAKNVLVSLTYANNIVTLTVTDDGMGLNGRQKNSDETKAWEGSHFGLVGIQERVKLIGGQVNFSSPPQGGTVIEVVIPNGQSID